MTDDRHHITDAELDQILRTAGERLDVPPMRDAVAPARLQIEARADTPGSRRESTGALDPLKFEAGAEDADERHARPEGERSGDLIPFEPERSRWREIGLLAAGIAAAAVLVLALVAVFGGLDPDGDGDAPSAAPALGVAHEIPGFEFVRAIGAPKVPNEPLDVAIGRDGTRYVVDIALDRVVAFTPGGAIRTDWGDDGMSPPLDSPHRIAIGPDGELYVLSWLGGRVVHKLSPDGDLLDSWPMSLPTTDGDDGSEVPSGRFAAIAVDSAGNVYVGHSGEALIFKWDAGGELLETIQLDVATIGELAIDSQDRLYVTTDEHGLRRVGPDGSTQPLDVPVNLGRVSTHSIGGDDTIVALIATNDTVVRYDLQGNELNRWELDFGPLAASSYPIAIAKAVGTSDGSVLVCDPAGHRLLTYNADGELVAEIADERPGRFGRLWRVAVADDGGIYGLDPSVEGQILEFGPDGELRQEIDLGTNPVRATNSAYTTEAFAIAPDGRIVLGQALGHMLVYAANGKLEDEWAGIDFGFPYAIAVDEDGFIYIVDDDGASPKKFTLYGDLVATLGDSSQQSSQRYDLAYHDGAVWMTDGDQIIRYPVDGGEPEVIARSSYEAGEQGVPGPLQSLDLDAEGNIYVYSVMVERPGADPVFTSRLTKLNSEGDVLWSEPLDEDSDRYIDIAIGPDGTLYLADSDLHQILAYRPVDNALAPTGACHRIRTAGPCRPGCP